jgi:hypothetical protein
MIQIGAMITGKTQVVVDDGLLRSWAETAQGGSVISAIHCHSSEAEKWSGFINTLKEETGA